MKNIHLIIVGILLFLISIYTGPIGIVNSLTGLGTPSLGFQFFLFLLSIVALLGLKKILNERYKYNKSDRFLYIYLVLSFLNFISRNFHQSLLINKSLQFIALIIFILTPLSALLFYISVVKIKNFWLGFYAVIGVVLGSISLIQQLAIFTFASIKFPSNYVNSYVIGGMASGVLTSYIKMVQNFFLGGILIVCGLLKNKR